MAKSRAARPGWRLVAVNKHRGTTVHGQFTTERQAQQHAKQLIAQACGVKALKLPTWGSRNGEKELIYGRDERSWWFRIEAVPMESRP